MDFKLLWQNLRTNNCDKGKQHKSCFCKCSQGEYPVSLISLCTQSGTGRGWVCNGWGQAWAPKPDPAHTPRLQLVKPLGEVSWARTEDPMSSASDKRLLWLPEVFKGEVAKIITRVWEENQGVAWPRRRLGGSNSRWRQHASTSKAAALRGGMSWEGHGHAAEVPEEPGVGCQLCFSEDNLLVRSSESFRLFSPVPWQRRKCTSPEQKQNQNWSPLSPVIQARPLPPVWSSTSCTCLRVQQKL